MSRQILHGQAKLEELAYAGMSKIETGIAKLPLQRIARVFVLPRTHQAGKTVQGLAIEAERLADLARRRTATIRDDIGCHGSAQFAVALIHILNGTLALIATGKVEIDIGPLAAFLREEALKQQPHSNRIDSRYAQGITDRAVGRGASSLNQDSLLTAMVDDVPHNKKISGQLEPLDEHKLALNLPLCALPKFVLSRPEITVARAHQGAFPQNRVHGSPPVQPGSGEIHSQDHSA